MDSVHGRIILHGWFGAGLILTNPKGMEFTYDLRFRFDATNNEAKYEALIAGLMIAERMGAKNLQANVDSRLLVNQVNETYVAKEADMIRYLEKVRILTSGFKAFSIRQVPRCENKKADALRKITSTSFAHIRKEDAATWDGGKGTWGGRARGFGTVPVCVRVQERAKKIASCMGKEDAATWDGGKGTWGGRARGFGTVPVCVRVQERAGVHKPVPRNPQQKLTPITSPWPFYKWEIDIAGPFPEGPGKVKFLIVVIDYFTKTTLSVDLDSRERLYWTIENSSGTVRSKIGARNYASASTLLPLNIRKPMAWWKDQTKV
nr:reverse transcriptase domain-containing protein [Tanacetum cinerariifolium]